MIYASHFEKNTTQYYCLQYRSPEEYMQDAFSDEKMDVYTMGNNIYVLMTGLWPFYTEDEDETIQHWVRTGKRPYIDDRYRYSDNLIEREFVKIMEEMWEGDIHDRPDIFKIVKWLRNVKDQYYKEKQEGEDVVPVQAT